MSRGTGSGNFLTQEALSWNIALLKDNEVSSTADTPFPLCPLLRPFLDVRPHRLLLSHQSVTLSMCVPAYREWPGKSNHWPPCPSCQVCSRASSWYVPILEAVRELAGPEEIALVFLCSGCLFLQL